MRDDKRVAKAWSVDGCIRFTLASDPDNIVHKVKSVYDSIDSLIPPSGPPPSVEPTPNPPSLRGALSNLPSHRGAPSILSSRPLWILPHHLHITAPHLLHPGSSSTTTAPRIHLVAASEAQYSIIVPIMLLTPFLQCFAFCQFC
jgi:hypothetical protein